MDSQVLGYITSGDYKRYRPIRHNLKVVFACLTAIPFVVFAFIYFRIGAFNTALSGFLVALVLTIVLEGFMIFRKMADHVEQLSSTMTKALEGKAGKVQNSGATREFAIIADTFNRTLFKLEDTAQELGVKAVQAATLNEIREMVSTSINMEEIAKVILSRAMKSVNAKAGYLATKAIKKGESSTLHVAATVGIAKKIPNEIPLDANETLAGLVSQSKSPIVIEDIKKDPHLMNLNSPDIGLSRLLYFSIVAKGNSIGVLVLGRQKKQPPFEDEYIQFLQTLLQQIAYSVENARLYENLQRSNKKLEAALDSQQKAQDQMLASARMAVFGELSLNIAHELNNPLTGILGYTDLILDAANDDNQL